MYSIDARGYSLSERDLIELGRILHYDAFEILHDIGTYREVRGYAIIDSKFWIPLANARHLKTITLLGDSITQVDRVHAHELLLLDINDLDKIHDWLYYAMSGPKIIRSPSIGKTVDLDYISEYFVCVDIPLSHPDHFSSKNPHIKLKC